MFLFLFVLVALVGSVGGCVWFQRWNQFLVGFLTNAATKNSRRGYQPLPFFGRPIQGPDCTFTFGGKETDQCFKYGSDAPRRLPRFRMVRRDREAYFFTNFKTSIGC